MNLNDDYQKDGTIFTFRANPANIAVLVFFLISPTKHQPTNMENN